MLYVLRTGTNDHGHPQMYAPAGGSTNNPDTARKFRSPGDVLAVAPWATEADIVELTDANQWEEGMRAKWEVKKAATNPAPEPECTIEFDCVVNGWIPSHKYPKRYLRSQALAMLDKLPGEGRQRYRVVEVNP